MYDVVRFTAADEYMGTVSEAVASGAADGFVFIVRFSGCDWVTSLPRMTFSSCCSSPHVQRLSSSYFTVRVSLLISNY